MKKLIAIYSSSPILAFAVGSYQFENGVLQFEEGQEDSLEKFQAAVAKLPRSEVRYVKRIDVEKAEQIVRENLAAHGSTTTQKIDSTVGERVSKPKPEGNLNEDQAQQEASNQPVENGEPVAEDAGSAESQETKPATAGIRIGGK